jgi:hypothetical protein
MAQERGKLGVTIKELTNLYCNLLGEKAVVLDA